MSRDGTAAMPAGPAAPAGVTSRDFSTGHPASDDPASDDTASPRSSVVSRVMDVLGAFSVDGPRLRAADIARRSGLPSATTHRVLQELTAHGAVERGPGGRYTIGPRMWEIGRLGTVMYRLWIGAQPHLRSLARLTPGRPYLSVLSGGEGMRLDATAGAAAAVGPCWVVERLPLHATAAGQVLLAFAGPGVVDRAVRAPLTRYTEHTVVSVGPLCQLLGEVRRNAVAVSRGQHQPGEASVAAPVFGPAAAVVGAIEVVLRQGADLRRPLSMVARTAHEVSQDLAATEPRRRLPSQVGHVVHPVEISERSY